LDQYDGLVISGSREDLGLAGRDVGVPWDDLGHDTASGLDTECQWVDISEEETLGSLLLGQDTTLDSGTKGNSLIRVNALRSLLATEVLLEESLDLGDTSRTTDQDNVVDITLLDTGILKDLLNGLQGLLEEIHIELLELSPGESLREVLAIMESFDFDPNGHLGGQGSLGFLNLTLKLTHGLEILGDIGAVLLVVELGEVLDDTVIEIFSSQVGITSGGQNLEETVFNGEERNIKGTSTEIVDDNLAFITLLVETVGEGSGGRLVDDTENVETGNNSGILGSLTLVVVEVGWNGDDSVGNLLAQVGLGDFLHLAQNHGGDLFRSEGLLLTLVLDTDDWLSIPVLNLEWKVLDVGLDVLVLVCSSNKTPV